MTKFTIYSDGGARGNPGPAAFGFLIKPAANSKFPRRLKGSGLRTPDSTVGTSENIQIRNNIVYGSGYIGKTTNNQAEYQGILAALSFLKSQLTAHSSQLEIECLLDSQLIVEQMNGKYKIKNEGLKPLYWEIRQLIMDLGGRVFFHHISREENTEADKLVNEAIDKEMSSEVISNK